MGTRAALYMNPNHLQALAILGAALAQLGRTAEAVNAADVLLSNLSRPDRRPAPAQFPLEAAGRYCSLP